jgi:hypothetical protein
MTGLLAAVRPDSWNFPLFVHVLGAMVLVGGLLTGASILAFSRGDVRSLRLGYWTLLAVALPGYVLMRIGAQWIYTKEGWDDLPSGVDEPTWLPIGYVSADGGGIVFLITLVLGGIGIRRLNDGRGAGLLKATLILSLILLAAYVITVWAMSGKPG